MAIKALLFDFDGVILDSLQVKTQAFYDMYLPYGKDIAEQVAKHHLEHGGVSRFEKFKLYHKNFLGLDISSSMVDELAKEFSKKVLQGVIKSSEVKGIRDFLAFAQTKYSMWVITGTPTTEIIEICKETQLTPFFQGLYGSPEKKDFWTKKILSENNLHPSEVVFIGDATADYEAAINNNIHFILREHPENIDIFKNKELIRIHDFTNFQRILEKL